MLLSNSIYRYKDSNNSVISAIFTDSFKRF